MCFRPKKKVTPREQRITDRETTSLGTFVFCDCPDRFQIRARKDMSDTMSDWMSPRHFDIEVTSKEVALSVTSSRKLLSALDAWNHWGKYHDFRGRRRTHRSFDIVDRDQDDTVIQRITVNMILGWYQWLKESEDQWFFVRFLQEINTSII